MSMKGKFDRYGKYKRNKRKRYRSEEKYHS